MKQNYSLGFLPISRADMQARGWEQLDFLFISGDAYVDHPSFGAAILTRLLENAGYRVGIIAQPDWKEAAAFKVMGRPRLGVLLSSGVIDSMVNHYTVSKKQRSNDVYSPGGQAGLRPDRALLVYTNRVREVFKKIPVIIGGIEASLRRFAHYDYWSDTVRRSLLVDARADLLVYGMGERPLLEIASRLASGEAIDTITDVRGTVYNTATLPDMPHTIILPSFEAVKADRQQYARAFLHQYREQDPVRGRMLVQAHGDRFVVQNIPALPLDEAAMDRVYALPFQRTYHPVYREAGGIPAINEVKFSITSHRGCYGGCSFCALTFHQGRLVQRRSQESIIAEAEIFTRDSNFKGYIHDVGGPTANFRSRACRKQEKTGVCRDRQCLENGGCPHLIVDHREYLELLRKLRQLPGIKKVFIRSGIRYDYLMLDHDGQFFEELCAYHISGQLKVAPEHVAARVLAMMGKPGRQVYDRFVARFYRINRKLGKKQYLVPYLISGHPGSELRDAVELAEYLRDIRHTPEQVQDFYPTPGTLSTCMFYTGLDPRTMEKVYIPRSAKEKAMQRALLQYRRPENYQLVYEALLQADRSDLIGFGPKCLIRPPRASKPRLTAAVSGQSDRRPVRPKKRKQKR
jgi:uncharacterized radical SAM protein YgiQ